MQHVCGVPAAGRGRREAVPPARAALVPPPSPVPSTIPPPPPPAAAAGGRARASRVVSHGCRSGRGWWRWWRWRRRRRRRRWRPRTDAPRPAGARVRRVDHVHHAALQRRRGGASRHGGLPVGAGAHGLAGGARDGAHRGGGQRAFRGVAGLAPVGAAARRARGGRTHQGTCMWWSWW